MDSREFDVKYLEDLALPYDRVTKELTDNKPRIVDGSNTYITRGGKIALRPGFNTAGLTSYPLTNVRADRLVIYETLENPPKIYLVASIYKDVGISPFAASHWEIWWLRLDATSPAWTVLGASGSGSYRHIGFSQRAHEIVVSQGLCYIKSFPFDPAVAGDVYGSVVFNGAGTPSLKPWGIPGPLPTTAAGTLASAVALVQPSGTWNASTSVITVNIGWKYYYCYESSTGQYSNRSPATDALSLFTNDTGPFTLSKVPLVQYQGLADTTNIPYVVFFRTVDGGGTPYYIDRIANPGAGTQYWEDNKRAAGVNDPKLDVQLDTSNIAPSLTSNTVPPTCVPPGVIGTTGVQAATKIGSFAGRLWYMIGSRLYFSGREEVSNGVPEECWVNPNGIRGNYFILQSQGRLVQAARETLFIITANETGVVLGEDRTNLRYITICTDIGGASGHPHAICSYRDGVFFLSQDLQVYGIAPNSAPTLISEPLGSELRDAINARTTTEVQFEIFNRDGNSWLLVLVKDKDPNTDATPPAASKLFVYDLTRNIWFTPWTPPLATLAFGRIRETDQNKHLIGLTWVPNITFPYQGAGNICIVDLAAFVDGSTAYAPTATFNLFAVPAGNHINSLRAPAHHPMVSYLLTERTKFTSDTDPTIEYRLDEFSGTLTTAVPVDPPYTNQHVSYNTKWSPIQQVCQRVQLKISKTALNEAFELQNIGFVFQPEAGA